MQQIHYSLVVAKWDSSLIKLVINKMESWDFELSIVTPTSGKMQDS